MEAPRIGTIEIEAFLILLVALAIVISVATLIQDDGAQPGPSPPAGHAPNPRRTNATPLG